MDAAAIVASIGSARVERSFAFLDLCGFTDFVDANGDAAGVTELRSLRSAVRDVAPRCGVRVDKWLGDGVMLVGVEIEPLVAAVLGIEEKVRREASLPLRAGVATGSVILLEGDDYVGRTVNLAARLCDRAEPGEVLAATDGWFQPPWVDWSQPTMMAIKGLVGPVEVVALGVAASTGGDHRFIQSLLDSVTRGFRSRSHPG